VELIAEATEFRERQLGGPSLDELASRGGHASDAKQARSGLRPAPCPARNREQTTTDLSGLDAAVARSRRLEQRREPLGDCVAPEGIATGEPVRKRIPPASRPSCREAGERPDEAYRDAPWDGSGIEAKERVQIRGVHGFEGGLDHEPDERG